MARRNSSGITLIELVIAMLILSIIAGVATQAFLMASHFSRDTEENSLSLQAVNIALQEIRRDLANLVGDKIAGFTPYGEVIDPSSGEMGYRLLVRLPEGYIDEKNSGVAQAMLVTFTPTQTKDRIRLIYTKQAVGPGGLIGESLRGVLSADLARFRMTPTYASEKGEASGGEVGALPEKIQVTFEIKQPGGDSYALAQTLPIYVQGDDSKGKEGKGA